jgi:capsule polysaccharide export protein KpsE/RkpR
VEERYPQRAADLANAFVQELQNLTGTLAVTEASQRRLFFERQLVEAKDKLADAEEALKTTQLKTGLIMLDSQARAVIETVATLRGQIAAKEVQITAMRSFATEQNPELIMAEQQLAAWRKQLSGIGGGLNGGSEDLLLPKGQVPQAGLEYLRKYRELKYRETVFEILAKQFEIAKLDEAKQGSIVQVVDPALKPERRSFPKRTLIVLISTFLAFVVALFLVLFEAHLRDRPDDWERIQTLKKLLFIQSRPQS